MNGSGATQDGIFMLVCGLLLTAFNSMALLVSPIRRPPWCWDVYIFTVLVVQLTFVLWLPAPRSRRNPDSAVLRRDALIVQLPLSAAFILNGWLVKHDWAGCVLGIAYAIAFYGIGRIVRRRPYYVTAAAWFVAGLAHLGFFAQREPLALFFLAGGVVTAAEGAWEWTRYTGLRQSPSGLYTTRRYICRKLSSEICSARIPASGH